MDERYMATLKALAEPSRLRLFWLLAKIDQRACVTEAMDVLDASHYNVSRNLKELQKAGLVTPERRGNWVFYRLREASTPFLIELFAAVRSIPQSEFTSDIKRCRQRLAMRENGRCVVGSTRSIGRVAATRRPRAPRSRSRMAA